MRFPTPLIGLLALAAALLGMVAPAQAAVAPVVADSWAASVSTVGADLRATVDSGEAVTNVRFEYLTDAAYRANLDAVPPRDPFFGAVAAPVGGKSIPAGPTPVEVRQAIGGLKSGTTYHFRVVATNAEGSDAGPARIFTIRVAEDGSLLDGRGWEMVSPVDKNGGEIQGPGGVFGGGVFQAAAAGGAVTYSSSSSFAGGQGAPGASQYLSTRTEAGWATANITTPTIAGAFGVDPDGVPYQLFSGDLARAVVADPQRCESAPCPRRYQLRQSSSGALAGSPAATDLGLAGADAELTATVISTCSALTANAVEMAGVGDACDPSATNLYAWSGGAPTLINLLPGDSQGTPGATLAAEGAGSVSAGGSRIYFSLGGNLYLRSGGQTVQVDQAAGGGGVFQAASADGSVAFFLKDEHLYRFTTASGAATDLTPAGGVLGVLGVSGDGAYLYYVTADGLFLRHGGITTGVAAGADPSDYPPSVGTSRIAANGNLVFLSPEPQGEIDTGGFSQVYLYRPADGGLLCISCNPSGARPLGPSVIPGAVSNGELAGATRIYKPRALSASGSRVFFESADALVLTDSNQHRDVYEWEAPGVGNCEKAGGCLGLVSSGLAGDDASFLDASADGGDAFFVTSASLVPTDLSAADVYDARIGGGFPLPIRPIACEADNCQVVPGEPDNPALGTGFFRAEGNPPVTFPKSKKKKKKHHKKKHHRHHKEAGHKKPGTKKQKGARA